MVGLDWILLAFDPSNSAVGLLFAHLCVTTCEPSWPESIQAQVNNYTSHTRACLSFVANMGAMFEYAR